MNLMEEQVNPEREERVGIRLQVSAKVMRSDGLRLSRCGNRPHTYILSFSLSTAHSYRCACTDITPRFPPTNALPICSYLRDCHRWSSHFLRWGD
nr:hypothetical protein Iba_chr12dCG18980 [Ipomoea batatas]